MKFGKDLTVAREEMDGLLDVYLIYKVGLEIARQGDSKRDVADLTCVLAGIEVVLKMMGVMDEFNAVFTNLGEQVEKKICPCCRDKVEKLKEDHNGRY